MKMYLTVMTPTYNRQGLLRRLYDSLCSQSCHNFEWLIVDDGSTDETKEIVNSWIEEKQIRIRYIYQANSGKAAAFNTGIKNAEGELLFCVDSDDYLSDTAVADIAACEGDIEDKSICGILALKSDINGKLLGGPLPEQENYLSSFELSEKHGYNGEWSLIYKTEILKHNIFPIIRGEKFITECVVYDRIAQEYRMRLLNKVLTVCEYQENGYTGNLITNMLNNPTGYKIYYAQRIDMAYTWKARIGYIIRYNVFSQLSPDKNYNYTGKYRLFVKLLWFAGILGRLYYRRLERNEKA